MRSSPVSCSSGSRPRRRRRTGASARSTYARAMPWTSQARQARTDEAVELLDQSAEPELHGIVDIRAAVDRAGRDATLSPRDLAGVASTIETALRARGAFTGLTLGAVAAAIDPGLDGLAAQIRAAVDDEGTGLRDTASPLLRRLRRELRDSARRVEDAMQRLVRSSGLRTHLQESFVATRAGRPVLAVKAAIARERAGHRPRRIGLGPDALRRAVRGRRAEQPAVGDRGGRARGDRAPARRAVAGGRRAHGGADGTRRSRRRARPRSRLRRAVARLARHAGRGRRPRPARRPPAPAARPGDRRPDRPRARPAASARDQRAEHRRQDGRVEVARARRRAAPVGAARACRRGGLCPSSTTCSSRSGTSSRLR